MPVQFVNEATGEVLSDAEVRKLTAPKSRRADPKNQERRQREDSKFRMPRSIAVSLWIAAILVSNFVGFAAGAMGAALDREELRADNAELRASVSVEREHLGKSLRNLP